MTSGKRLRRLGCILLLIPWFLFLLTPCLVITLAIQQEIVIARSDLPDDALRIWVIQEREARGIGVANARRVDVQDNTACLVIDVRFFLWSGDAEKAGALPSHHCACYRHHDGAWMLTATGQEACLMAGERLP